MEENKLKTVAHLMEGTLSDTNAARERRKGVVEVTLQEEVGDGQATTLLQQGSCILDSTFITREI